MLTFFLSTDKRIYNGLLRVMEFGQSEDFNVPVDLNVHPIYGMIIAYPMDLSTIKARLENRFYRRVEAILFDVGAIEGNALQYNEETSEIVKRARIVTTVLRRFITDPDSYDPMPIYTQILSDLEQFMQTYEHTEHPQEGVNAKSAKSALYPLRRSTRERRSPRRAGRMSEEESEDDATYGHARTHSHNSRPSPRISQLQQEQRSSFSSGRSQRRTRPPAQYQHESFFDGLSARAADRTQEGYRIQRAMAMSALASASSPPLATAPRPWQQNCRDLLDYLFDLQDSGPFRSPVDPIQYPTYEQLIDTPMDLTTVKEQLLADIYDSPSEFCKDMRLIFSNSKQFNTNKKSRIYSMTIRLGSLFEEKMRKIMADHKSASAKSKRKPLTTFSLEEEEEHLPHSSYLHQGHRQRTNTSYYTPGKANIYTIFNSF